LRQERGIHLSFRHSWSLHVTQERGKADEALIKMHLSSFSPGLLFSHTDTVVARDASRCTRAGRVSVVINANFLIRISVGNSVVRRVLSRECRGFVTTRKTNDNVDEREKREEETWR